LGVEGKKGIGNFCALASPETWLVLVMPHRSIQPVGTRGHFYYYQDSGLADVILDNLGGLGRYRAHVMYPLPPYPPFPRDSSYFCTALCVSAGEQRILKAGRLGISYWLEAGPFLPNGQPRWMQ
jgi:hypothetical protein